MIAGLITKAPYIGALTSASDTAEQKLQKKPHEIVGYMTAIRALVLPRRLIGVLLQTFVDLLRLSVSENSIVQRQILSLISVFLELSRKQWQNALLSAIGFYSQNAAYMGIIAKVILNNFLMIDKRYGENILEGIITVPKSYVLGVVIFLYQTFATDMVRKDTMEFLERVLQKEKELSQNIEGSQYADQLQQHMGATELNFDTLNLLQIIIHDRARTCSDKFQAVLQKDDPAMNPLLRVIFLLLDIPLTPEELVAMCPGKNLTWAQLAFKDGKVAAPSSSSSTAAPTGASTTSSVTPVVDSTAPSPVAGSTVAPVVVSTNTNPVAGSTAATVVAPTPTNPVAGSTAAPGANLPKQGGRRFRRAKPSSS